MSWQRIHPFQGTRLTVFQMVIIFTFAALLLRVAELQFMEGERYTRLARENSIQAVPIPAPRGVIYDRDGEPLALNVPAYNVIVIPAYLPDTEEEELEVLAHLSALIDVPVSPEAAESVGRYGERTLLEMVREGQGIAPYRPVVVARDVDPEVAMRVLEERLDMPGVDVEVRPVREYPTGALTAQIVGYLGPIPAEQVEALEAQGYDAAYDRIGYAGVEYYLEDELAGRKGERVVEVDVAGLQLRTIEQTDPIPGTNVQLTIDVDLQRVAQDAIARRIQIVNADAGRVVTQSGVVIAMNPQTGEVLAMVSWPTYDNSRFARFVDYQYYLSLAEDPLLPLVNHAISALYPPGSVWKLIVASGALEEHVIDPATQLRCEGSLVLENRYAPNDPARAQTFVCWLKSGHGDVDMLRGIAESCDIYFYQIGGGNDDVPPELLAPGGLGIYNMFRYATAFGIGMYTGVELPGEIAGRMPDPDWKRRTHGENWSTGDTYNASIGQGYVNVTPIQLINAVAAIANGGNLYRPTIVHSYLDAEGNVVRGFERQLIRTIVFPDDGSLPVLLPTEDVIINGPDSIFCVCDPASESYDPDRCDPENYHPRYDANPDPDIEEWVDYTVNIWDPALFDMGICSLDLYDPGYVPAFVSREHLQFVQRGMREVVLSGTGRRANLPYVAVAGKTGTAEYCDDIARPLGLCVPGNWPSHAWFVAYAPYDNPEIIVLAFLYNGGEGSVVALPVVREVLEAYFAMQAQEATPTPAEVAPTPAP